MRQTSKTRRTIGIRGQLMGFLCFICLLLVGLFWFLSTQLLEPLYTTHIQKQLTEQAEAIVARMDEAIGKGETLLGLRQPAVRQQHLLQRAAGRHLRAGRDEQLLHRHLRHHPAADLQGG